MGNCYFLMLLSITFLINPLQSTIASKINSLANSNKTEHKTLAVIGDPQEQFTYQKRTYKSGILFEKLSNIKISYKTYHTEYHFYINKFIERIEEFRLKKMAIEKHCQNKLFRADCGHLTDIIDSLILFGKQTMEYLNEQGECNKFTRTLYENLKKTNEHENEFENLLGDAKLRQFINETKVLMEQQKKDSRTYYELFNKLQRKTAEELFPKDTVRILAMEISKQIKDDEEHPKEISTENPYEIFSIVNIRTNYRKGLLISKILLPILKKQNYTLYKAHSAPVILNNKTYGIESNAFFLLNSQGSEYIPMREQEIRKCKTEVNGNRQICTFDNNTTRNLGDSCQSLLIKNKDNQQISKKCKIRMVNKINHILSARNFKINHCIITHPVLINMKCKNKTISKLLNHSGFLKLNPNCSLIQDHFSKTTIYSNITNAIKPSFDIRNGILLQLTTGRINMEQIPNKEKRTLTGAISLAGNGLIAAYSMGEKLVQTIETDDKIDNNTNSIIDNIDKAFSEATGTLSDVGNSVLNTTQTVTLEARDGLYYIISGAYSRIANVINGIVNFFGDILLYICGILVIIFIITCLIDAFRYRN